MATGLPPSSPHPSSMSQPDESASAAWLTPAQALVGAVLLMCLLALASRLHAVVGQAEAQGALAIALVDQLPMQRPLPAAGATEGDKAPQIATIQAAQSLALAVTPVSAVLSLTHCVADRCEPVYERADAPVCQGRLSWPALCVPVASTLSPQDTLIVGHDLRPALRLAALDIAIGLSVLAAVMWVWRRARAGQSGAELVSAPRLKQVAETDALTGLLNRVAFEAALQRHNEGKTQTALDTDGCLMYFDLDRFKLINDTHGHIAGDTVLKTVAQRLRYTLGGGVLLGRLGGDEFAALLTDVSSRASVETICRVLIEQVTKPIQIDDVSEWVGLSIGAYMLKRGELDLGEMLHRADLAMYEAKRAGRGRLIFYDPSMEQNARSRAQIQADLKKAIELRQFFMVYQPQFDAQDRIRGMSASVRWRHPARGLIPPQEFMPIAEKSGMIVPLGKLMLELVCADLKALRNERLTVPYVSLSVSLRQLADSGMVQDVQETLVRHALTPADLEFEVSESTAMVGQAGQENATLKELAAQRFRIAVDGFGSGHSSLSRLLDLEVDKIKIDGLFVHAIGQPHFNPALLELMISLAARLGVKSVAEGVQTVEQVAWLRRAGCQMVQGDLYGEPMNRVQLINWLRKQEGDDGFDGGVWAPTQVMEESMA